MTTTFSILLGITVGVMYGLSMHLQYQWLFQKINLTREKKDWLTFLVQTLLMLARVAVLVTLFYFLLLSGMFHLILFVISFLWSFLLVVLKQRA